jgi:hypothetical protein
MLCLGDQVSNRKSPATGKAQVEGRGTAEVERQGGGNFTSVQIAPSVPMHDRDFAIKHQAAVEVCEPANLGPYRRAARAGGLLRGQR